MSLGRRRFACLALPAARRRRCSSPDPVLYTLADQARPASCRPGPTVVHAARHRPGELSRPPRDRALVGRLQARRPVERLVGRAAGRRCWAACWSSSCRSACRPAAIYAESGAISADPNAVIGVNIQRLDADSAGAARSCWPRSPSSSTGRGARRRAPSRSSKPLPTPDTAGPGGRDQRRRRRADRRHRRTAAAVDAAARSATWHDPGDAPRSCANASAAACSRSCRRSRPTCAPNCTRCGTLLRRTRARSAEPPPGAHLRRPGAVRRVCGWPC